MITNKPSFPEPVTIESQDGSTLFVLDIPDNLVQFEGHFPEHPILPGVVILDWVMHLADKFLQISCDFSSMEAIKFKKFIQPGTRVNFELELDETRHKLKYRVYSSYGEHSSGKFPHCYRKDQDQSQE